MFLSVNRTYIIVIFALLLLQRNKHSCEIDKILANKLETYIDCQVSSDLLVIVYNCVQMVPEVCEIQINVNK